MHRDGRRAECRAAATATLLMLLVSAAPPAHATLAMKRVNNLLDHPVEVESVRISVAERADVIIDFSKYAGKTLYIENRLEQVDGRGPTGKVLAAGQGNLILKIVVDLPAIADNNRLRLFSGSANIPLAQEVARYLGMDLGPMVRKQFADGEIYIQIQ